MLSDVDSSYFYTFILVVLIDDNGIGGMIIPSFISYIVKAKQRFSVSK